MTTRHPDAYDRVWWWRKWLGHRKGQACRIVRHGPRNACLVEFHGGYAVLTSRYAVRKPRINL